MRHHFQWEKVIILCVATASHVNQKSVLNISKKLNLKLNLVQSVFLPQSLENLPIIFLHDNFTVYPCRILNEIFSIYRFWRKYRRFHVVLHLLYNSHQSSQRANRGIGLGVEREFFTAHKKHVIAAALGPDARKLFVIFFFLLFGDFKLYSTFLATKVPSSSHSKCL